MTASATNVSDTSTWLPLDGLAPGFDGRKQETSDALVGRGLAWTDEDGGRVTLRFGTTLEWTSATTGGEESGRDEYEVFEISDDLYYVQFHPVTRPSQSLSVVLDLASGHVLTVRGAIGAATDLPRVSHHVTVGTLDGAGTRGDAPTPTTALLGRRVLWEYSDDHAYEHVYLSPQLYTWHCLAGPERGLADTDVTTTYQLRPGIYVFMWREKVIPCASVTLADHRDLTALRSSGVLFGLDESGTETVHFTFGASGRLLSSTIHPADLDPAR